MTQTMIRLVASVSMRALSTGNRKPLPPLPTIDERDLEEKFVKGSGPGGQNVNKRTTKAQIVHLPTGLVVQSHETRSLHQNRNIARRLLAQALDQRDNGANSRVAVRIQRLQKQKAKRNKRSRIKYGVDSGE
jgi:protein subunit release factor B